MEGCNKCIKEFYWQLWFGDDKEPQDLDVCDTFTSPDVSISANDVKAFCAAVGNQQEKFKTVHTDEVKAPMDYAIITGRQAIMKSIFPSTIDGDLLQLVRPFNGSKLIPESRLLKAGNVYHTEAWVVAIVNSNSGKTVRASGHVLCEENPVMRAQSAFFFRGRFTDYENTLR